MTGGFYFRKNLDGSAYVPSNLYFVGKNSVPFQVGDPVRINQAGFADISDAVGDTQIGICVTVVDNAGKALTPDSGTLDKWTMNSANQTVGGGYEYKVGFIPALPQYLFYNDADATLTRTMMLQYFDCTVLTAQIDVNTATDTPTAAFRLIQIDPDGDGDLSKGLFQMVESQLGPISVGNAA